MSEVVKVSEAQAEALRWLAGSQIGYAHWAGKLFGHPTKAALNACLRRGWAERHGDRAMDLYGITEAGKQALAASGILTQRAEMR